MVALFYVSAAVALVATAMAVTRANGIHALLYLVISLLATAGASWALGAPLAAALEVIVYAGAIVVLFVFVVMLLGQQEERLAEERRWIRPRAWLGPAVLAAVLLAALVAFAWPVEGEVARAVEPKEVGLATYGPYLIAVEAASFLLLAAVVGAWHVGRPVP